MTGTNIISIVQELLNIEEVHVDIYLYQWVSCTSLKIEMRFCFCFIELNHPSGYQQVSGSIDISIF